MLCFYIYLVLVAAARKVLSAVYRSSFCRLEWYSCRLPASGAYCIIHHAIASMGAAAIAKTRSTIYRPSISWLERDLSGLTTFCALGVEHRSISLIVVHVAITAFRKRVRGWPSLLPTPDPLRMHLRTLDWS